MDYLGILIGRTRIATAKHCFEEDEEEEDDEEEEEDEEEDEDEDEDNDQDDDEDDDQDDNEDDDGTDYNLKEEKKKRRTRRGKRTRTTRRGKITRTTRRGKRTRRTKKSKNKIEEGDYYARFFKNTTIGKEGIRLKLHYILIPKNPESDYAEAILKMPAPKEIRPMDICPDNLVRVNRMGLALGWGNIGYEIESTHLNEVNLTVKGISEDKVQFFTNTVYNETVLDTCVGDSGGPLLFKQKDLFCLAGTVESGLNCGTSVDYHTKAEEEGNGGGCLE